MFGKDADEQLKEKYDKVSFDDIKRKMVALIEAQGLPVGFVRDEADFVWGIRVNTDRTVTGVGYASPEELPSGPKTIDDLCMVDLAYLLDDQYIERGKLLDESFNKYL